MKNFPRLSIALLCVAPTLATSARAAAASDYRILAHYLIGGDTSSYDYLRVDPAARRLYVSHEKRFEVLDADTGKKVGEIGGISRAHGIAIAPESGHGFASSGIEDVIVMFDLKTLATIKTIKSTGSNPDAIEYDPGTKRVYAGNHGGGGVTVIDAASGDIVGTVMIEGKLEGLVFDDRGQGYVNVEDKSSVAVFDLRTLKPKALWSVAPGEGGTGLGIDPAHHRIFSACANNKVVVLDSDTGKVVATPASGEDPDGLAFDPKSGNIFTSNPDGTMTIIHEDSPDKYTPVQTVATMIGAKTITLDEKTGRVVLCAPKFGPKPAPVKGGAKPKAPTLPGTFEAIVVGMK
ncbi:MAG: YncE family protein [Opitutaceae bacterium]